MIKPLTLRWKGFAGLDNRTDAHDVQGPARDSLAYLSRARNVDINVRNKPQRRPGQTLRITGSCHSIYAQDDLCVMVSGSILYRVWPDWTVTALRSGIGDNAMSYAYANNTIYYTNEIVIGYVDEDGAHEFTAPSMDFKVAPFAGKCIEHSNGRLYIAKGKVLWFTDALSFNRIDMRKNFKQLPTDITMVKAVDDGMYLSDEENTYFMQGGSPTVAKLTVVESATKQGAAIVVKGQDIKKDMQGSVLLFVTENGLCLGTSKGEVVNLTKEHYKLPSVKKGAAILQSAAEVNKVIMRLYN